MRTVLAVLFLVAGILLTLVFLDEFRFHATNGDATQYEFMFLSAVGSIACFRVVLGRWRPVRRADRGERRPRYVRKASAVVFSVAGALLVFQAALGYRSAPWPAHELKFAYPIAFGLAAVACFTSALSDSQTPREQPISGSAVTPGG